MNKPEVFSYHKLGKLSRRQFRNAARDVAQAGFDEYKSLIRAQHNQNDPGTEQVQNISPSKELILYQSAEARKLAEEKAEKENAQFHSGLVNDATVLVHVVKEGGDNSHFFQGVLSLAAFKDDLKTVRAMVEGTENLHAPLSPRYLHSNALFNAVIGGAKETTNYLLQAGADPVEMLERNLKGKRRNPMEAKRMKQFAQMFEDNSSSFLQIQHVGGKNTGFKFNP